jgi:hypothetical protein
MENLMTTEMELTLDTKLASITLPQYVIDELDQFTLQVLKNRAILSNYIVKYEIRNDDLIAQLWDKANCGGYIFKTHTAKDSFLIIENTYTIKPTKHNKILGTIQYKQSYLTNGKKIVIKRIKFKYLYLDYNEYKRELDISYKPAKYGYELEAKS